ncbi:thiamine ABC transporter substrate-binding protein [Natronococcus pandeyae]|uniref:Thiamine ABC transporter substrate-binding protein n=1 Tax=Natronococcus pandeyae TaxID=2055836 RepID=A0A8J8Q8E4_9EURY|nr:extracellular solute-binding protein [Natronococcus pandeyae]TYL39704.1 thiamine ABC transporter substrate-binding protein [Natronococcus pandeyae]
MKRRSVVRAVGSGGLAGLAGCFTREADEEDEEDPSDVDDQDEPDPEPEEPDLDGTLRIATTESIVRGERAADERLRELFEEEFPDAELQWTIPEAGLDHYVQRVHQEAEIDADVYFGLTPAALARVDREPEGRELFRELNQDRITAADRIREDLEFGDPNGRVLPSGVRYSCLLYEDVGDDDGDDGDDGDDEIDAVDNGDHGELEPPETLADLTAPEYEESLLIPHPERSDSGLAFLLWTIDAFGSDYLEYWRGLEENGARITDGWAASDEAYAAGERPLSVAYSTDPVLANREDRDPDRYRVAFPDEQGYENPLGMAIFEHAEEVDLAYDFLNFALSNEVQAELAERQLQIPAVSSAFVDLDEEFEEHAEIPVEAASVGYDRLREDLEEWLDDWRQTVGGG